MNRLINIVTGVSFAIGSIIFLLFLWTSSSDYLFAGYLFIVVALLVNITVYIIAAISNRKSSMKLKPQRLLLNIPVAFVYVLIAIFWINIVRLEVVNDTNVVIHNFQAFGCGDQSIEILKAGESKTLWISPNGDCNLELSFVRGDKFVSIPGIYFTNNMGQKLKIRCSSDNFNW